jgi:parvulin-like peptidyl-prolyl isomerase
LKRAIGAAVGAALIISGCGQQRQPDGTSVQTLATAAQPGQANTSGAAGAPIRSQSASDDRIIARVNGQPITMRQLMQPLLEAHGLTFLLNMARLELVKQEARKDQLVVSAQDVQREQELTMAKMFKDSDTKEQEQLDDAERKGMSDRAAQLRETIRKDRETFLQQYLQEKNYSRAEYDLVIEINAYLRKLSERDVQGKISDELVEKEFGVEYGETAEVRYIQLANMNEVNKARQRIQAGEDFGKVAREMSRNARTAAMDGKMVPFSRQTPGLPDAFKQMAFALQPGQVSDTLSLGGNWYIIKLEQKFAPKAVKFDAVKESLRKSMTERVVEARMDQLRNGLNQEALVRVRVEDPLLSKQFENIKSQREAAIRDKQKIDEQLRKERTLRDTTQPATTAPATTAAAPAATSAPTTQP